MTKHCNPFQAAISCWWLWMRFVIKSEVSSLHYFYGIYDVLKRSILRHLQRLWRITVCLEEKIWTLKFYKSNLQLLHFCLIFVISSCNQMIRDIEFCFQNMELRKFASLAQRDSLNSLKQSKKNFELKKWRRKTCSYLWTLVFADFGSIV